MIPVSQFSNLLIEVTMMMVPSLVGESQLDWRQLKYSSPTQLVTLALFNGNGPQKKDVNTFAETFKQIPKMEKHVQANVRTMESVTTECVNADKGIQVSSVNTRMSMNPSSFINS